MIIGAVMLSLFALVALAVLAIATVVLSVFAVKAFTQRGSIEHAVRPRRQPGGVSIVLTMLVAVGFVFLIALVSFSTIRVDSRDVATMDVATMDVATMDVAAYPKRVDAPAIRVSSESRDAVRVKAGLEGSASELAGPVGGTESEEENESAAGSEDVLKLPAWTQINEQTLVKGHVPTVLSVVHSGLYATQDEANRVAFQKLNDDLRTRLSADYPALATWTIPQRTLEAFSVKQSHVEVRETQFGQFKEPMYQVWLQYEDSPHVREPVVAEWRRSAVDGRVIRFAAGTGIAALLLGTISAGFRTLVAPSGRKGRAALATVALAAGTGLAAASLFVS